MKNLTLVGKIAIVAIIIGILVGVYFGVQHFFPQMARNSVITTKATGLPPLSYDKGSNAPLRNTPEFNEPASVEGIEVRGLPFGWNGFAAANYAVGGTETSKGSLAEEAKLNIHLSVQNSCSEQCNQLYAFAQALHDGEANPSKGVHFINLMGDGVASYITGLNQKLMKDFGEEYRAEVVTFTGASYGEDKWMLKKKYATDARGSVTATVKMDGDWDIAIIKSQLQGWDINNDATTYERNKVNFVPAPNNDYIESGKMYLSGAKVTLHIAEDGKLTGKDTTVGITGVASWFPVDQQIVTGKGGMVTVASTKDFPSQMGCAIIMIKKWADANKDIVVRMIEVFGKGGDQIKSHDEALQFASKVSEVVFADKEKTADDWYKGFKSFDLTDDDGNTVNIGGSRAFSLADAANYTGVDGSTDDYKKIYTTFANIDHEADSTAVTEVMDYSLMVDWKFLKEAYNNLKGKNEVGTTSRVDISSATKGDMIGDANYAIEFDNGSAVIKPASYAILDKILGQLAIASDAFVEVAGHTSSTGNPQSNQTLSEQRAQAVMQYLQSKDEELTGNKVSSKGYGSTHTLTGVDRTDAKNRRVEIKLYRAQ